MFRLLLRGLVGGARAQAGIVVLVFGARQVVGGLQIQPESRIDVKKAAEANGRVGGNVAPPADDVADTVAGDANGLRQGVRGEAEGL